MKKRRLTLVSSLQPRRVGFTWRDNVDSHVLVYSVWWSAKF